MPSGGGRKSGGTILRRKSGLSKVLSAGIWSACSCASTVHCTIPSWNGSFPVKRCALGTALPVLDASRARE
eukprot:scaffold33858_cov70-Phaeocystis_antarctica.AAC.6